MRRSQYRDDKLHQRTGEDIVRASRRLALRRPLTAFVVSVVLSIVCFGSGVIALEHGTIPEGKHAVAHEHMPAANTPTEASAITRNGATGGQPDPSEVRRLIQAFADQPDRENLSPLLIAHQELGEPVDADSKSLHTELLSVLATSGNRAALEYVRGTFETSAATRDAAAVAIARYALDRPVAAADWQFLLRSLTVVEGDQARLVMQSLQRFRMVTMKPVWVRQVILLGLRGDSEDDRLAATSLLSHWTAQEFEMRKTVPPQSLDQWQDWFRDSFPNEPDPVLPSDLPDRRWTWTTLKPAIEFASREPESVARGRDAYVKARCDQCHVKGNLGQTRRGPDLSSAPWRLQPVEMLESILYPSHRLNDEYPNVSVITDQGRVITGMQAAGERGKLTMIAPDGTVTAVALAEVDEIITLRTSSMPDGLLEPLTLQEVRDLFAWLCHQ